MKGTTSKRGWPIGCIVATVSLACVAQQLSAADMDIFERSLEYTRAELGKHHLIGLVEVEALDSDKRTKFRYDRYREVERLQVNDTNTFARKKGDAWLKSEDWADGGTKATAKEAKVLDVLSSYVDVPLMTDATVAKKALAGTAVTLLRRENKGPSETLYYQMRRDKPGPLLDPEFIFQKSARDVDERSLLAKFYGVLWPHDKPVKVSVRYILIQETLAEQKTREKKSPETKRYEWLGTGL
jgi:hypothetical protein